MTISPSINDLKEHNGLKTLTSFLSIKETSRLRSSSSKFRTEIPNVPEEAKAFLIFVSKRPMIQNIIERTATYARDLSHFRQFDPFLQRYISERFFVPIYVATPIFVMAGWTLKTALIAGSFFLFPLSIGCVYLASRRCWIETQEARLRQLWIDFRNQPAPQDLIMAAHDLIDEWENYERLYQTHTAAGGMDRYYATVGIDRALEEIQIHLS